MPKQATSKMRDLAGIGCMCAGTLAYTVCDALGKWLVAEHSVAMLLLVRSLAAGIVLLPLVLRGGGAMRLLRQDQPGLLALRALASTMETVMFFVAVRHLALAEVLSVYLAAPLLVVALSPLMLGESVSGRRWRAVLAGFLGVLLLLRPGSGALGTAALPALVGMVALAISLILTRRLRGTPPIVLVAHQVGGTLLFGLLGLVGLPGLSFAGALPGAIDAGLMAAVGLFAMLAQFLVAWSMRLAPASLASPFFYSALLWALAFDLAFWGRTLDGVALAGAVIIIASGLWIGRSDRA